MNILSQCGADAWRVHCMSTEGRGYGKIGTLGRSRDEIRWKRTLHTCCSSRRSSCAQGGGSSSALPSAGGGDRVPDG